MLGKNMQHGIFTVNYYLTFDHNIINKADIGMQTYFMLLRVFFN